MLEDTLTEVETEATVQPLNVDVYAFRVGDIVLFAHAWGRGSDPKTKQGKIEVPKKESDVPIHFQLHDLTEPKVKLSFYSDACDSIWVDTAECPTEAGHGGQIEYGSSGGNSLKVTDLNSVKCTLHFALRFDGDPLGDGPPYEYDPEIRNGGSF